MNTSPKNTKTPRRKHTISWLKWVLAMFLVSGVCLSLYGIYTFRQEPRVIAKGHIVVPASLVDVAAQGTKLFYILYASDSPMPLAVMAESIRIKVDTDMRMHGYRRSFAITLEKLEFMRSQNVTEGDSLWKNTHHREYQIKVRLDHDGRGGRDAKGDIVSEKASLKVGEVMDIVLEYKI